MDSQLQQKLARIFLAGTVLLNILVVLGVIHGASVLIQNQKMVDHTNRVISEIEIAKNLYQVAEYTGRNRNLTGANGFDLPDARKKSLEDVARLKTVVSDNPEQMANLDLLRTALEKRFAAQDEQFQTLTRGNGFISYPTEVIARGTQYAETIDSLFSTLKLNEINLLRTERQPQLTQTHWRVFWGLFVIAILNFAVTIYLNVKFQRLLGRTIHAGTVIYEAKNKKDIDWNRLAEFIQGKREEYELPR